MEQGNPNGELNSLPRSLPADASPEAKEALRLRREELVTDLKRRQMARKDKNAKLKQEKEARRAEQLQKVTDKALNEQIVPTKEAAKTSRPVRDAIHKIIIEARASGEGDKTRLEALIDKGFQLAMHSAADFKQLMEFMEFIASRTDGKPAQEIVGGASDGKPNVTINIAATRFGALKPPIKDMGEVIDVTAD